MIKKRDEKKISIAIITIILILTLLIISCQKDEVALKKTTKQTITKKYTKTSTQAITKKEPIKAISEPAREAEQSKEAQPEIQTVSEQYTPQLPTPLSSQQTTKPKPAFKACSINSEEVCQNKNPGDRCSNKYILRGYCRFGYGGSKDCTCQEKIITPSMYY